LASKIGRQLDYIKV